MLINPFSAVALRCLGKYRMNWLRPDFVYAETECPEGLNACVENSVDGDIVRTAFRINNMTSKPVFTGTQSIGIKLPLEDRYEHTDTCLTSRAHVHLFCGQNVSWAMALRMGSDAPHLGLILTSGSLESYSILHHGIRSKCVLKLHYINGMSRREACLTNLSLHSTRCLPKGTISMMPWAAVWMRTAN